MNNKVDDFVRDLQDQISRETKEAYGEIAYQRWLNPLHMGSLKDPDGYAILRGVCGDTIQIFLNFENGRVKEASFQTNGCGSSIVCSSFAAEMALGKNPDELLEITGDDILEKLKVLPNDDQHCAFLAAETLQGALNEYMVRQSRKDKA